MTDAASLPGAIAGTGVTEAADRLYRAALTRTPCLPVRDLIGADDVAAAYAVQTHNTARATRAGRRIVGRKIGLTSKSVQRQIGVGQPDFGALFADMAVGDGGEAAWERVLQPKVEGEVALVLERDLDTEAPTVADVMRAIAYAVAAIEVVDSRIADWDIRLADTVADNASSGLFVLGGTPRRLEGLDLRLCGMVLELNGQPVAFGAGATCLGHPLNAAVWLARRMAVAGNPLRAGDIVLTGALGPMVAVEPGDTAVVHVGGLGSVRVAFGPR